MQQPFSLESLTKNDMSLNGPISLMWTGNKPGCTYKVTVYFLKYLRQNWLRTMGGGHAIGISNMIKFLFLKSKVSQCSLNKVIVSIDIRFITVTIVVMLAAVQ